MPSLGDFYLPIDADVSAMPVTTASQIQDFIRFDLTNDIIIIFEPNVSALMHPSNIMAAISAPSLMRNNSNKLVITSVKANTMLTI